MVVEPSLPRFELEPTPAGLRIAIPARRNVFVMLFFCVWLCFWWFAERQVLAQLKDPAHHSPNLFLVVWLAGWTAGGVWVAVSLLWQIAGREIITLESGLLTQRVEVFGIGRNRTYDASRISRLRAVDSTLESVAQPQRWTPPLWTNSIGPIAFDYGASTVRMGRALSAAEAQQVIGKLNERRAFSGT